MSSDSIPTILAKRDPPTIVPASGNTIYTCPMYPEVQQDRPGDCPKCGMALEPKTVTAGTDDEENAELRDMTKRFWIGAALTVPVFVLAMAPMVPAVGRQPWVESPPHDGFSLRSPHP